MGSKILNFFIGRPKTYIPLIMIIVLQFAGNIGIDVTPELQHSFEVVLGAIAAYFVRRNMVKEKNIAELKSQLREEIKAELKS